MPALMKDGSKPKTLLDMTPFERLVYWITTRESIRQKKELGLPKPWTHDPILRDYRFCNVVRMEDKVSQWLLKNWYKPYRNHPNMLVACTLARHFNRPESLDEITGFVFREGVSELGAIRNRMRALKAAGYTIFNGAYMVRGIGTTDKTEMVVDNVARPLLDNPPTIDCSSMQAAVEALLPYWGFSSFMAGQVVADLRWAMQGAWKDRLTWAPIGPGSKRGMNRLLGNDKDKPMDQKVFLIELQKLMSKLQSVLPTELTKRMEAIDYQNCLCEFDKFTRALTGEGKPKQRYQGES